MMNYIGNVGNLKVFTEHEDNTTTVSLYNGSDSVFSELYSNTNKQNEDRAIEKALEHMDIYTLDFIFLSCPANTEKLTENTYRTKEDYFCRIDNTRYFKHLLEPADGWTTDKSGLRIIDR